MSKDIFKITKEFNTTLNDLSPNNNRPIVPKYEGTLNLAGIENTCYVTEDGLRILSSRRLQDILKVTEDKENGSQKAGNRWSRFLGLQWFQSLLEIGFDRTFLEPIELRVGKSKIVGYKAELIPEICEIILRARREGKLNTERQQMIAEQCEILLSSLAKVGIVALIDEATGYQYNRKHDALRILLDQYINEGLARWLKTFPDDFFTELDRLYLNNETKPNSRPKYYGKFINKYVYSPIEDGFVKQELDKLNITDTGLRKARFHQWLTDFGRDQLKIQIGRVMSIMEISNSMEKFKSTIRRQKSLKIQPELFPEE